MVGDSIVNGRKRSNLFTRRAYLLVGDGDVGWDGSEDVVMIRFYLFGGGKCVCRRGEKGVGGGEWWFLLGGGAQATRE
jgi:hypothetical protein